MHGSSFSGEPVNDTYRFRQLLSDTTIQVVIERNCTVRSDLVPGCPLFLSGAENTAPTNESVPPSLPGCVRQYKDSRHRSVHTGCDF